MNTQSLKEVMSDALEATLDKPEMVRQRMEKIAKSNAQAISRYSTEDILRVPTADELVIMRQYAIDLKKKFPMWSKRKLRKDVQAHFNIRIYK